MNRARIKTSTRILTTMVMVACRMSAGVESEAIQRVVVIHFDTTRMDDFGCYAGKVKTPNVDRLAERGMRYLNSVTTFPRTAPSVASFLTGQLPMRHGVYQRTGGLENVQVSLAEILSKKGFVTGGFVSNRILVNRGSLRRIRGFAKGFDVYKIIEDKPEPKPGVSIGTTPHNHAELVVSAARDFIRANANNRFFLWMLHFDPHTPYHPPEAYTEMYVNDQALLDSSMKVPEESIKWAGRDAPQDSHLYIARHQGEVTLVDTALGPLLLDLEKLPGKTLYIVTSDHGESLGDNDYWFGHGGNIRWPCSDVPLIITCDGLIKPGMSEAIVANIDLAPTILDMLGIDGTRLKPDGRSLVPTFIERNPWPERTVLLRTAPSFSNEKGRERLVGNKLEWYGLRSASHSFQRSQHFGTDRGESIKLYDRLVDPLEKQDISLVCKELADKYASLLNQAVGSAPVMDETEPAPESEELLEALGYLD